MFGISIESLKTEQLAQREITNGLLSRESEATKITEKDGANSEATKTDISKNALSEISNLISKEECLWVDYSNAKKAYETLSEARKELAGFMSSIKDSEVEHDIGTLEELDKKSNELINRVVNIFKNDNVFNTIDAQYANIFLKGLTSLAGLDIRQTDYIQSVQNLLTDVINKKNNYKELSEKLYLELEENSTKFEELVTNKERSKTVNVSAEEVKKSIFMSPQNSLLATTNEITSDVVMRLLMN